MMSRTNYEAVSDYVGHWLHRAQVSLLTGATGQIKLSHIAATSEKTLVRAWCGPGAGLVRAWCGPRSDRSRGAGLALRNSHWTKASAKTYVNMFEGPVTGNIPEVLDNGEVTDGTHVTAGQLALALTPYAQVTGLAVNTAASGSIAALQSSLTTGLSNKADQSAFDVLEGVVATKSTPDGVDLKLSNYSTTAAMNGSNNATLATVAANYGLKTVVDQRSLDIAARITPLEDTKVANALLGAVTAAALASELASRDASISGLQASKADASALTAYALQSAVDTSSEVDSKIATALLDAVTTAALAAFSARRTQARWPPCSPRWTGWTRRWR